VARAFVIRPFGEKTDSKGNKIDFEGVHMALIVPALVATGLGGGTTGEIVDAGNIREDMFKLILEADLVIADVTIHNANVFYELGIRHALRKKHTVMIRGEGLEDATPFDLLTDRYIPYPANSPADALESLTRTLKASLSSDRETDSPVFAMMDELPEADPERVSLLPPDFKEEVDRARAAQVPGWLALLADEVSTMRFQMSGLKLVADAQWKLKDYTGARRSWEAILDVHQDDIRANLALANIYERLYRESKDPVLLRSSDHALDRVLRRDELSKADRAEALSLRARNLKTRWRLEFTDQTDVGRRREAAMNRLLIELYQAYRIAYYEDLNAYYPGLGALQMGTVLVHLEALDAWDASFDEDDEASQYKARLAREVAALHELVPAAVVATLERLPAGDLNRLWARISKADVQFLTSDNKKRIVNSYVQAVPIDDPFAWDATKGQLDLFRQLDVKADIASAVIEELDQRATEHVAVARKAATADDKPLHLIVMGGHCIDGADRAETRFPAELANKARDLLKAKLQGALLGTHETQVLASAAPGADILAHEICREMKIASHMCLPMPPGDFSAEIFPGLDVWRSKFLDLVGSEIPVLQLSDRPGTPRWLSEADTDPWDRGNRWVMSMAKTWGADRVTLVVLWDGKRGSTGGTAQMVELAEKAGEVHVVIADLNSLNSEAVST